MKQEKKVTVIDKFGKTLAIFTNEDDDTLERIIDPHVTLTQNSDNIFTFSIPLNSEKWEQIKDEENLYIVDGHVYSPHFKDCYTRTVTEDGQNLANVKAYERQKLLQYKYVTAWNSTTGFEKIDEFMVVILSKGNLPLTNAGENVSTTYPLGSAGYILQGLLWGTGWSVGIVDVEGTFDFETEQLTVYDNVLKVQELYGGILIWDSVNKIVHLRDEINYKSYSGYEIRRGKNLQNFEEVIDNSIITRLCPLGEAGLDIRDVNDGDRYIENYSYSNETYEKIENNPDIHEAEQLLEWGKRKLQELCRPRKTITASFVYLSQKEEFKNEELDLNDSVDVIGIGRTIKYNNDTIEVVEEIEQLRVLSWDYNVFLPETGIIELGDTTKNTTDIFKKISNSTNAYTSGNIDTDLLQNYNTGNTVTQEFEIQREQNITFQTNYEGLDLSIKNVANQVDAEGNRISTVESSINDIKASTDGIEQSLQNQGGNNLLLNSSAFFGNDSWRGVVESYTDTEIQQTFFSKNCFLLQKTTIGQNIAVPNGIYYVGFKYKKLIELATCTFSINENPIDLTELEYTDVDYQVEVTDHNIKIEMTSDTNDACYVGDIIVVSGAKQKWSPNSNEVFTDNIKIGQYLEIYSNASNTKLKADTDGVRILNSITNESVAEFTDKGTITNEFKSNKSEIAGCLHQQVGEQTWISSLL